MGSCSSGGPQKYSGMCFKKSEAARDEDIARSIGHEALILETECRKRQNHDERHYGPSVSDISIGSGWRLDLDDKSSLRHRCGSASVVDSRHTSSSTPNKSSSSHSAGNSAPTLFPSATGDGAAPFEEHSFNANEKSSAACKDLVASSKRSVRDASTSPIPSGVISTNKIDLRQQQHRHNHARKTASSAHRWPGEYGTCIVAPPNKSVYDVCKPHLDYSTESSWTTHWTDKEMSSTYDQHYKGSVEIISGRSGDMTNAATLLPSTCLPHASSCSASSSSSADSSSQFRRRGSSGSGGKRSSSLSSCPSSTAELLPAARQTNKDSERRQIMTAENRALPATQRLWNLLRSPMEPLNGSNFLSSSKKYMPLSSEASSQSLYLVPSTINNTVSNKNADCDRKT